MAMKTQDIIDLMGRFDTSGIGRMKITSGDTTIELEKPGCVPAPAAIAAAPAAPVAPAAPAASVAPAAPAPAPASEEPAASDGPCITAPLVGTFYVAPSPDKDPYVQPGDRVKKGDTVCLLEAMKMMSEVTAPVDCVIDEIMATDGELVSFGAPLIRYHEA
ncbi:MAG TPA: acetyl-CoA carboxylase biotin carboxyl carrier protein [Collinsella ihuae]|uniref:Biotin carboxyl carrier protein of acetyl-CoA carboxylase n=1 Tax=Collinsella ihumii TaxID=1720204 RepID=A0A921IQG2_9ACTN|nr:acetyl-CoA carboxylase biotin carboxyl carrier protein [Collinsella ihumii]